MANAAGVPIAALVMTVTVANENERTRTGRYVSEKSLRNGSSVPVIETLKVR